MLLRCAPVSFAGPGRVVPSPVSLAAIADHLPHVDAVVSQGGDGSDLLPSSSLLLETAACSTRGLTLLLLLLLLLLLVVVVVVVVVVLL